MNNTEEDYPKVIFWKGLNFHKQTPQYRELVRYHCKIDVRVTLWKWHKDQWCAQFAGGSYAIAPLHSSYETALELAAEKAVNMLRFNAAQIENLLYRL